MLLVTTERIAGREIEPLGIVEGSSVQTVHAGKDIMNSLKTLVGGELTSYTEMMEKARTLATDKMVKNAQDLSCQSNRCYFRSLLGLNPQEEFLQLGILGSRYGIGDLDQHSSDMLGALFGYPSKDCLFC